MKVVTTRQLTENNVSTGDPSLDAVLNEIADIRSLIFEGKAGRSKAEAKAAKQKKNLQRQKLKSKRGGGFDPEKASEVEKKDTEAGKKKVNTKLFGKSSTNLAKHKSTPDALIHNSEWRKKMPSSDFINPKKKTGPTGRGLASALGTLRQAQEHGTPDEKAKAMAAAKKAGVKNPHDKLSRERSGCTPGSSTYSARECKPHGPGGPDEWLRKSDKKGKGHKQEVRKKTFAGHGKVPEQIKTKTAKGARSTEHAHALFGGHAREREIGATRNLGPADLAKRGIKKAEGGDINAPLSGRKLRSIGNQSESVTEGSGGTTVQIRRFPDRSIALKYLASHNVAKRTKDAQGKLKDMRQA